MPKYPVERNIPGANTLTPEELRDISAKSNSVVDGLGAPYIWHHSYVAGDKIYCVHEADNAEIIYRHAREGGFPADLVVEIESTIDPETGRKAARECCPRQDEVTSAGGNTNLNSDLDGVKQCAL